MPTDALISSSLEPLHGPQPASVCVLTYAAPVDLLKPHSTEASAHWYQPLPVRAAVHPWGRAHFFSRILHADPGHFCQPLWTRQRLWKTRQAPHCLRASLVIHSDRHHRYTSPGVLESQVEAPARELPDGAHFCVQLHGARFDVSACEASICCHGVELSEREKDNSFNTWAGGSSRDTHASQTTFTLRPLRSCMVNCL